MQCRNLIASAAVVALAAASAPAMLAQPSSPSQAAQQKDPRPADGAPSTATDTDAPASQHDGARHDGARHDGERPGQAAKGQPGAAMPNRSASTGAAAMPTADYVAEAARSDIYEIQSSELALRKAQSPAVKQFAEQMIRDHKDTSAKLNAAIASARLSAAPPTGLDARRQAMLDALDNQTGAAFDSAYLEQQTAAHQEALALHSGYAARGDNAALKTLAAATTPRIQHHYDMVKQIASGQTVPAAQPALQEKSGE